MTRGSESRAVRNMASAAVALETSKCVAERRARLVPDLSASIERNARGGVRRRTPRVAVGAVGLVAALAAAAALLVMTFAPGWLSEDTVVGVVAPEVERESGRDLRSDFGSAVAQVESVSGSVQVILGEGKPLGASGLPRVEAVHAERDSGAIVRMGSGARILVGPSTSVEVSTLPAADAARREEISLSLGRVDVTVPRLDSGESFEVVTEQARVLVHGTRFLVEVGVREAAQWTKVAVTEGRVSVHHDSGVAVLGAGSTWTSLADEKHDAEVADEPDYARRGPRASPKRQRPASNKRAQSRTAPQPRSSLAAENLLFQSAMQAARDGDDARALALMDEFLAKYPRSPLAPNALLERRRALTRVKRPANHVGDPPSPPAANQGGR